MGLHAQTPSAVRGSVTLAFLLRLNAQRIPLCALEWVHICCRV